MRNFILGTDWWDDCDDAVALRILTRSVKEKKINLLGIGINACMEYSAASIRGFLLAENVENISLGIDLNATDFGGSPAYQKRLAEDYCPNAKNEDLEDAVRLYRRILAESSEKVEIMEIGFLQVIAGVLKSGADDISERSGLELVREKVSKIWVMAGKWDADGQLENNFCRNSRSRVAGKEFCELCPVPVTFLGWEIGNSVITGGALAQDDHLRRVLMDHGSPKGRLSWDPMLVLLAVTGDEEKAGYDTVRGTASVEADTGKNHFLVDRNGKHCYIIKKHPDRYYADLINDIL